jgi:hypothetical protein
MHDEVGNDVRSGPSSGHDDPVFATEISPADEASGPIATQLPRICYDTPPWLISISLDTLAKRSPLFFPLGTVRIAATVLIREEKVSTSLTRFE